MISESGKVNQTPLSPRNGISNKEAGMIIMNCLNKEMIKESDPFPNDSKTPAITIPIIERIKAKDKIRKPLIPISNIA